MRGVLFFLYERAAGITLHSFRVCLRVFRAVQRGKKMMRACERASAGAIISFERGRWMGGGGLFFDIEVFVEALRQNKSVWAINYIHIGSCRGVRFGIMILWV